VDLTEFALDGRVRGTMARRSAIVSFLFFVLLS